MRLAFTTKNRNLRFATLVVAFLIVPFGFIFAAPIGFPTQQIWFSKEPFFAGDKVTISALLVNSSDATFSGAVVFWDNNISIGEKSFSLTPAQSTGVVSIEWDASAGDHRIRAKISGAILTANGVSKPADIGTGSVDLPSLTVDTDTDGDDLGNTADSDDDNDLVADADESTAGTDPLKKDSDGDGVSDPDEIKAGTVERPVATTTRVVSETLERYVPEVVRGAVAPAGNILEQARLQGVATITKLTEANKTRIDELRGRTVPATTTTTVLPAPEAGLASTTTEHSVLPARVETPFRYVYWGVLTLVRFLFTLKALFYIVALGCFIALVRGTWRFIRRRRGI